MHLRILLPFQVFADRVDVRRIVAETTAGAYGFWPHRLDCVAALVPGILTYESDADGEVHIAVDEGALVKTGPEVRVRCGAPWAASSWMRCMRQWSNGFCSSTSRSARPVRPWRAWKPAFCAGSRSSSMKDDRSSSPEAGRPERLARE